MNRLLSSSLKAAIVIVVVTGVSSAQALAQSISGYILDENNDPIPFANIFVRELESGASSDEKGRYFLTINPGFYNLVISSVGFKTRTAQVVITDNPLVKNFWLESSSVELSEVVVRARRRDPAYEIIQAAIRNKDRYLSQIKSSQTNVYVRAAETVDLKKKKEEENEEEPAKVEEGRIPLNPAEEARRKEEARLQQINLTEMDLVLNYQYPDRYKEERTAYKSYGNRTGLYIPLFSDADFNFYRNLVDLKGISEIPVISPISRTAVLSYKYQMEETLKESSGVVYKIRFTPRKTGDATGRGHIYINDSTWSVNRLELSLRKGGLKFYDDFTIRQTYEEVSDSLWIPMRQEFEYETKSGSKTFRGSTVVIFSDFKNGHVFPPRFFGNEVAVTSREAYKRDSSYWNSIRPEPLTRDQQKVVAYRDSIEAAHKNKAYLDSIEAKYNKVTLGEIVYDGIGFRRDSTKRTIYFSSLINTIGFEVVGGWRLGPVAWYTRQFESGRSMATSGSINVGLKNADVNGGLNFWARYDPYHLGDASIRVGRQFYTINSFDAYLNQLRISNYILHDFIYLFHRREFINGLYLSTELSFNNRQSVSGYDATSIINEVIEEDEPLAFQDYQTLISNVWLSYTPRQKFMSEPNRKVVLGSRYPTFLLTHRKGWNRLLTSDVDFDYLEVAVQQNLLLGTLGNSRYSVMAGKFVNTRNVPVIDIKRFRQSDPYLMSVPTQSFQLLDTALSTTGLFIEGHYIHHFNGAMINNIPLVKKLRLQTVAGAGFMWISENRYRHEEIFGGVERVFKLGARRRLRIGVYGVLGQSNFSSPTADWKVSFDIIDTWKREWSY